MTENSYPTIRKLLASTEPEELKKGLELVRQEITQISSGDARSLFEMIYALFYIDHLDQPHLIPILDEAVNLVKEFGESVIPDLIQNLGTSDIKAQLAVAHA